MEPFYKRFVQTERLENGKLVDFSWNVPENFNFAYDVVDVIAREEPSRRALLWVNDKGETEEFSFADLSQKSDAVASVLRAQGIRRGDRVLLILKRHYEYWFLYLALHKLGAVGIPATSQLLAKDILYRLRLAQVSAVCCTADGSVAEFVDEAQKEYENPLVKILHHGKRDTWLDLHEEMDAVQSPKPERVHTSVHDPMLLYFTSGTTGMPKMVVHDFSYPLGLTAMAIYWHKVQANGLHLTVAETGWAKAAWGKMYGAWMAGSAFFVYDHDRFHAEELLHVIETYRVTSFCAPPTIYRFLIHEDLKRYDLSSIQNCVTAGEALNPEVYQRFKAATGLSLLEGYGQTELTLTCATLYQDEVRVGSMGKPFPGLNIDLVDENGKSVPDGVSGELVLRASPNQKPPGVFCGYYQDEELTKSVWHDGLYHTGDLAWRDEDGYFWYVSRKDDVIKSSGYRIGPFEVESVLMEHPAVLECAVTGVPDELRGFAVKATIMLARGYHASEDLKKELQTYVKSHTAPYKYPRVIEFVDELPKTVNGKIRRAALREREKE